MTSNSSSRFRPIALMIMSGGFNCGFEFEKGRQLLICMHNKASSLRSAAMTQLVGPLPSGKLALTGFVYVARFPSAPLIDSRPRSSTLSRFPLYPSRLPPDVFPPGTVCHVNGVDCQLLKQKSHTPRELTDALDSNPKKPLVTSRHPKAGPQ
jgi:hypothetical protein